ncbi:hypothetical protein [Chitinilyticum litopenaei]|uniref:hypothetical protein n=1 Tax=Chitinilyticum litopenaei TaxID=1121276 RepID=UPI0004034229|nr:hypothetical protein [Chitinilyticum litopenaei]
MNAPLPGQALFDLAAPPDFSSPAADAAYCQQADEYQADPLAGAGFIAGEFTAECERILTLLDTDPACAAAEWAALKDRAFTTWSERCTH